MRIDELLSTGKERFENRENAILDSEVLLAHVLGEDREYLLTHGDMEVEEPLEKLFLQYLNRVEEGEPVAYILNEKEFFGLNFFVDKRVLIPRPETEQMVEDILEFIKESPAPVKILDVGTGSGNIAIALGKDENVSEVLAIDIDKKALEVAKINVEQHSLENKIQLAQSDLLEVLEENEFFNIIVANLPYIGETENRFITNSTEKFEPHVALFGGKSGIELYEKMFRQIKEKKIGFDMFIGEFGFAQKEIMSKLLEEYFPEKWRIERDLAGIERIFIIKNDRTA